MDSILGIIIGVVAVLAVLAAVSVRVVQEYERGVVFRLGRLIKAKGPGLFFLIPIIDRMQKVDLRLITMDVPAQEVITKDNVTVKVNAVLYFRVQDPEAVVVRITDFVSATSQLSQTTLRNVCGQSELDEILAERERINVRLQQIIDEATEAWGVKVTSVEVKDIELPQGMQRAMARQAEAERDRRARIIDADAEFQAATRLTEAGHLLAQEPTTIQLRFLQTLSQIATEKNSTIVFPVPIDLISRFLSAGDRGSASSAPPVQARTEEIPVLAAADAERDGAPVRDYERGPEQPVHPAA